VVVEPPPASDQSHPSPEGGTDMKLKTFMHVVIVGAAGLAALPVVAQQQIKIDFNDETVGAEPKLLLPVVGVWRIENEQGNKVLAVDGRQWKEGQSSAGIADKAKALYGERYAEFLDRVQAFAYYPYAVVKDVEDFTNGEISMRFEGISGRIDQGAGILFNLLKSDEFSCVFLRFLPFGDGRRPIAL
jgi:hypothetical protein